MSDHAPRLLKPKLANIYYRAVWRDSQIPRTRAAATQMLGDLGPVAARAAPALVKVLADRNPILRRDAAFALGKIEARPDQSLRRARVSLFAVPGER